VAVDDAHAAHTGRTVSKMHQQKDAEVIRNPAWGTSN
jgi:hypothetical protein